MKKLLMVLPLVILICFTFACQDKEAMAELEAMKAQTEVEEQNKELISNFFEQWHSRNIENMSKLFAPNAKYNHPSRGATPFPFVEALEGIQGFWKVFPDLTVTIEDLIAGGDKVVVRFIGRGTHQRDLGGIPATGVKTELSAIEIFHIVDGKIVEVWEISDRLGLMRQLGMELKPKEETETHKEASPGEHAREGQDEHSEEGRGEHSGEGEETGQTFTLNETYDNIRKGVRLILSYDKASSSFIGTVENVTNRTIKSVRVEVHLSNGMELGPTSPIDLAPGKKTSVKLPAAGQSFNWWKTHPEAGSGEHSGEG